MNENTILWNDHLYIFFKSAGDLRGDKGDAIPPLNPPVAQRVLEKL